MADKLIHSNIACLNRLLGYYQVLLGRSGDSNKSVDAKESI